MSPQSSRPACNRAADKSVSGGVSSTRILPPATDSDLASAAHDLAANGWAVFPCRHITISDEHKAKEPLISNGHLKASRDPDQITAWWTRWPKAMIGAPVPESLLVVDFDPWKTQTVSPRLSPSSASGSPRR